MMPTSSEFVALCRAQIALLTQGLGASLSVVYLTQDLVSGAETQLVPIAAYPESARDWQAGNRSTPVLEPILCLPATPTVSNLASVMPEILASVDAQLAQESALSTPTSTPAPDPTVLELPGTLVAQRQLVLPLVHESVVLGLLVTERNDRAWNEWEQSQIQQIVHTLTIACVLDQRYQWLDNERHQFRRQQAQQHDLLDNLLHQFRNSLTALQTFGKLILRRIKPEDANHDVADSLVREAARLRELSQQLEAAVRQTEGSISPPLALPAAGLPGQAVAREDEPSSRPIPLLPAGLQTNDLLPIAPCDLLEILDPLLHAALTIATEQDLRLESDLPASLPWIWANPQALREVLNNLIENALKYTPAGGRIIVRAEVLPAPALETPQLEISVTDTGSGIPSQDLPHIFERRYRGVQAQTAIPGSGLGLAIARTLTEQMHGEIEVISPARSGDLARLPGLPSEHSGGTTLLVRLAIDTTKSSNPPAL